MAEKMKDFFLAVITVVLLALILLSPLLSCIHDIRAGMREEAMMANLKEEYERENLIYPVDPTDVTLRSTPNSTCFSSIGYEDGTLVVVFRDSDSMYCYRQVPREVWDEFKNADSLGGYYNTYIKGEYECEKVW